MIFLFDIPDILDNCELPKLINSEKLSPKEYSFLVECQESRSKFIKTANFKFALEIFKSGDSLLNFQKIFDEYLKTNVDMMYLLVRQNSYPPNFHYKTFLSVKSKSYTTSPDSVEESCACELVIVRYILAFLFYMDAGSHIKYIREKIASSFADNPMALETFSKEINQALMKFKVGREPLRKLYNVMPEILKSLVKKKGDIVAEFKGEVIKAIKLILEVNANSLYAENLRVLRDYENLMKICKGSHAKLEIAGSIFFEDAGIKKDVKDYLQIAMLYFKSYFCWAMLKVNEKAVKIEDYSKKNFTVLTKEILNLANSIMDDYKVYLGFKNDDQYYLFGKAYFEECFLPIASHYGKIYGGIHHNYDKTVIATTDELFKAKESLDYFDNVCN